MELRTIEFDCEMLRDHVREWSEPDYGTACDCECCTAARVRLATVAPDLLVELQRIKLVIFNAQRALARGDMEDLRKLLAGACTWDAFGPAPVEGANGGAS